MSTLRVITVKDGKHFFSQGIQADYAVQGDSPEQAKENFMVGLDATVKAHFRRGMALDPLLVEPPKDYMDGLLDESAGITPRISSAPMHIDGLPFDTITYEDYY